MELRKKKNQFYLQESLIYKMSFIYEKKRQTSYVISLTYVDPFKETNSGIILNNLKFVPSIGIIRRF
jgi:hypothetical protein